MPFNQTMSAKFPLRIKNFEKDFKKQMAVESIWYNLSGRTEQGFQIANGGDASAKVPNQVVMVVKKGTNDGPTTTIPSLDRLKKDGVHGTQVLSGTGEKADMRWMEIAYNLHRKAMVITDESVDGDLAKAYDVVSNKADWFTDWAVDHEDYAHTKAVVEGADDGLTDTIQWGGQLGFTNFTNATLHPDIYAKGLWSGANALTALAAVIVDTQSVGGIAGETLATALANGGWKGARCQAWYRGALKDAGAGNMGNATWNPGASTSFNKASLDAIAQKAAFTKMRLNGGGNSYGGKGYNFVLVISPIQANDLQNDTASAGWYNALTAATPRESGTNKVISGVLGVYRDMLIVVNPRNPVFDFATATFKYWTVANDLENLLAHGTKSGQTGTAEVAILMGRQSIAEMVTDGDWKYTDEKSDHGYTIEYGMNKKYGVQRVEFFKQSLANGGNAFTIDQNTGLAIPTVIPTNWSSFLYLTPTSAVSM